MYWSMVYWSNSKPLEIENKTNITLVINESVTYKITKVSKSLETVTSENDKEIPKESNMSPEKKTKNYLSFKVKIIV